MARRCLALGANDEALRAKAAKGPAPARVRRVEPDNNAASHRYQANDLTATLGPSTKANTASGGEDIERVPVPII